MAAPGWRRWVIAAATAIATAVPLPLGSITNCDDFNFGTCRQTTDAYCLVVTTKGGNPAKATARSQACCNNVLFSVNLSSCLGRAVRDSGHRRVPVPPA